MIARTRAPIAAIRPKPPPGLLAPAAGPELMRMTSRWAEPSDFANSASERPLLSLFHSSRQLLVLRRDDPIRCPGGRVRVLQAQPAVNGALIAPWRAKNRSRGSRTSEP